MRGPRHFPIDNQTIRIASETKRIIATITDGYRPISLIWPTDWLAVVDGGQSRDSVPRRARETATNKRSAKSRQMNNKELFHKSHRFCRWVDKMRRMY